MSAGVGSSVTISVDRQKLSELDSLEELEAELEAEEQARREKWKRERRRTLAGAVKMIEAARRNPKVRDSDPKTAHDAAMQAMDERPNLEKRLLFAFYELGEATADEASKAIGYDAYSASTHVSTLRDFGFVKPTGERRETRRGGTAEVLRCLVGPDTAWRQGDLLEEEVA